MAQSAAPVAIGGWQVAQGRKRKTVQVVSQLAHPVDRERKRSFEGDVTNVQGVVVAVNLGCGVITSPYTVHGGDEML